MKKLDKLPPQIQKVETVRILRQLTKSANVLGELRYLKTLENIGVFKSQKVGRETIYVNENLIGILRKY